MSRIRQTFKTADVLRVEVGKRPHPEGHASRNLLANPSGERGSWGWITPTANGRLLGGAADSFTPAFFIFDNTGGGTAPWTLLSEPTPATPGQSFRASLRLRQVLQTGSSCQLQLQWLDAAGVVLSQAGSVTFTTAQAVNTRPATTAAVAPAGTAFVQFRVNLLYVSAGPARVLQFDEAMLSRTAGAAPAYVAPFVYTNILGSSHRIKIDRAGLNLGTLSVQIADSALDPSESDLVRPGNQVRVLAAQAADLGLPFQPLFTGEILNGTVNYQLTNKREGKRARITLSAVDPNKALANVKQEVGVATIPELRYLMEGAGVPWSVEDSTSQLAGAPVVRSRNENASVLDQIASTRDTARGYAWVSRFGVLHADTAAGMSEDRSIFTEDDYDADLDVGFDTGQAINEVTVKVLSFDTEGKTIETAYGPFRHEASISEWGRFASEFTIQTTATTEAGRAAAASAHAVAVMAANATPARAVRSLSFRVESLANDFQTDYVDVVEYIRHKKVHLDLYDRIQVVNDRAGLNDVEQLRYVTSISHEISAHRWRVQVGFEAVGGVATPTAPAPLLVAPAVLAPIAIPAAGGLTTSFSQLWRSGDVVTLKVDVTHTGALPANTPCVVVPAPHRASTSHYIAGVDINTGSLIPVYLTAAGVVQFVFARPAGTGTLATFTYVAA